MDELYSDWLTEEEAIPWRVAETLRLPDRPMRQHVVAALAKELRFDPDRADFDVDMLLFSLVWPLNDLLEAGSTIFDQPDRHRVIATRVTSGKHVTLLEGMADTLGWNGKLAVKGNVEFGKLQRVVADSFAHLLSERLYQMLRAWEKRKVFERTRLGLINPRRTA